MSKIYILIEEISNTHINFDYHIIGIYSNKQDAINNAHYLHNYYIIKNNIHTLSLKVLEYPINTPMDYIDSNNNNTVLELCVYN